MLGFYKIISIKVKKEVIHTGVSQEILRLAQKNNGVVTTEMITNAGISRGCLKYLADKGSLERVSRGVYILPECWEDEFVNLQSRYKKGIFSLNTALFLCDLTDRTPGNYHMTFPQTYNLSGPKSEGILCSSAKESLYSLGIEALKTPGGNTVRPRNHTDIQVISEAFKRYTAGKKKNIPLLSEYARLLRVEERLRAYLEVLL